MEGTRTKTTTGKNKRITPSHKKEFNRFRSVIQWRSFIVCIALFQMSCASVPKETYLTNKSISGIAKVAILVSVSSPDVTYSVKSPWAAFWSARPAGLLDGSIALVGGALRLVVDSCHSAKIRDQLDFKHLEELTAQLFMQLIKNGNVFQITEYLTDKNIDINQLSTAGYDAVIRLFVRDISLIRTYGDNLSLHVYVRGQMKCLASEKILWDREEFVSSPEQHTLGYYEQYIMKELDTALEKASKKLAYDFIYP